MKRRALSVILFFAAFTLSGQNFQIFKERPIFESGDSGYECFRIPAIIRAANGDLIAFAEGRVEGCSDFGDVDIVMRISEDHGQSWSALKVVADYGSMQAGNPAPVLDRLDPNFKDGRIFLFYNHGIASEHQTRLGNGLRTIHFITSEDHGRSWSDPEEITTDVHRPNRPDIDPKYSFKEDWRSYALTPGHALQLTKGEDAGRLFIPANHSSGPPQERFLDYNAQAFFSDDHGESWKLSEPIQIPGSNESIAVELEDGRVMQNIRHQPGTEKVRIIAISEDGGESWKETFFDTSLISPVCQASVLSYQLSAGKEVVLFSNPENRKRRTNMTVKVSFDNGKSWPVKRLVRSGESAYSDLVEQADRLIGLLYEHGNNGGIHYAHFNMEWLLGSENLLKKPWITKMVFPSKVQSKDIQLAAPIINYKSTIFSESVEVNFALDYPGRKIHYTTDGSPPTINSSVSDGPIVIKESCELQAIAHHPGLRTSEVSHVKFRKATSVNKLIKEAIITPQPNSKYPGKGVLSLFDFQKGGSNFRDGEWMGFNGEPIEIKVSLREKQHLENIAFSFMNDQGSWIFLPASVAIKAKNFEKIIELHESSNQSAKTTEFVDVDLNGVFLKDFNIIIIPMSIIPDWHPGKDNAPWTFIDEILIDFQ